MTLQKLLELSNREMEIKFVEAEQRRIEPYVYEGDLQVAVKSDMGRWAKATGVWGQMHYRDIVLLNAEQRGWTQEGFTGLEMPHDD